ncbi:MAG: zinc-regulated TonB-dependent outer membrane receptor, partial [Myxococcota bacterium]
TETETETETDDRSETDPEQAADVEAEPAAPAEDADLEDIEAALDADRAQLEETDGDRPADGAGTGPGEAAPTPGQRIASAIQSLNPDLSFILDVAFAYFSEDENLQTGGHDPTATGVELQQLEMAVSVAVDPYFRVDGNIVFGLFGVEIEEFYATSLGLPGQLKLRLGQFLTDFGRVNPTHMHTWDFVDQPFALGRYFGGEGLRGLGVELSWLTPLPWYVELLGSVQDATGGATARSFFGNVDLGIDGLDDFLYATAVEQFFPLSEDLSLFWGLSAAFGPNGTGRSNATHIYGSDLYLKYRPITRQSPTVVSLQAEVFYRRRQVPEALLQDVSGYAQFLWRFAQRWATGTRFEWGTPPRDQDGLVRADDLDPEWTATRHRTSANVTFWPTEFTRFRLQGSVDVPTWRDDPIYALFFAAEFVTGAHGAHAF